MRQAVRILGIGLLVSAAASILAVLIVRDQMSRHRRDLFSSRPLRRLAALGYIANGSPSVDSIRLLRDYVAWERQPIIRRRAALILERMERGVGDIPTAGQAAG